VSLDGIAKEAAGEFAAAPGVTDQGAPQPGPSLSPDAALEAEAVEWSKCPAMFGMILARVMPELKATYTPENNLAWGRAMVPVAQRYGWTAAAFFAWLGPWVGLAFATHDLALPTYDAIKANLEARQKAKNQSAADAAQQPAAAGPAGP